MNAFNLSKGVRYTKVKQTSKQPALNLHLRAHLCRSRKKIQLRVPLSLRA